MSNLPHPLGDAVAGDLFYPGSPSVIVADVPSSNGSRAVDFGEDGTSSAINRGLYALGKNDEYMQARMETEFASPAFTSFTPAGGNGGGYGLTATVWCGDALYTPESQDKRNELVSVLDSGFNELIDDTTGDKIVVKEILQAAGGSTVVGDGFVSNPYVTFRRQDPFSGALGADYVIPDAVVVNLAHGVSAKLDTIPTDGSVVDSWFKGFARGAGGFQAGSFLRDGSRAALGNFNMGGFQIANVDVVSNVSAQPLDFISDNDLGLVAGADMALVSAADLTLKDQYLSAGVPLSETGETDVNGLFSSIVGSLNSKTNIQQSFRGDGLLNRTGSITFTGATGAVDYPELVYTYNGDRKTTVAGSVTAAASTNEWLVLDPSSGMLSKQASPSSGIPLAYFNWNGSTAFTTSMDVRRAFSGRSRVMEMTVSQDRAGADFTDLQDALDVALAAQEWDGSAVIRILGYTYYDGQLEVRCPVKIVSDGTGYINSDPDDSAEHGINCNGHKVIFENVEIRKDGGVQDPGFCAVMDAGTGSVFTNLVISGGTGTWHHGFMWTSAVSNVVVNNCIASALSGSFMLGSTADYVTKYVTNSTVVGCAVSVDKGLNDVHAIVLPGSGNRVLKSRLSVSGSGTGYISMVAGDQSEIDGVIESHSSLGVNGETSIHIPDVDAEVRVTGCALQAHGAITSARNSSSGYLRLFVSGTSFLDKSGIYINPTSIDAEASCLKFTSCTFDSSAASYSIQNGSIDGMLVRGCLFTVSGTPGPAIVSTSDDALISECSFTGHTTAVNVSGARSKVLGCSFLEVSVYGVAVSGGRGSLVQGNSFRFTLSNTSSAVHVESAPHTTVADNHASNLYGHHVYDLAIFEISTGSEYSEIRGNSLHSCCQGNASATNRAPIKIGSAHCAAIANKLEMLAYGLSTNQVTVDACVWVEADECRVLMNQLSYDIADGPGLTICAVYVASGDNAQINGNHIDFFGSVDVQTGTVAISLIYVYSGTAPTVSNNHSVGSWTDSASDISGEEFIGSQGDYGVYSGNRGKHDISTSGNGGIITGNCIEGATVSTSGTDTAANNV